MTTGSALNSFVDAIRSRVLAEVELGEEALTQASQNVGEFGRTIPCLLRVRKKEKVREIVNEANRWHIPLYPYSRGCNWGYGSKLPVCDGGVLLDLSALNRIVKINDDQGVATIEPGVTQRQLADELLLRGSRYYLDVTGSGADSSVLGNALERGVAYGSLRVQQLSGMEVLLGNGSQFRTGFGNYPNPVLAGLYPHGLGPSVDGLFFQSNFGIVLEGDVQLALRPERTFVVSVALQNHHLGEFVGRLAELQRHGYLSGIPHLADRERTISTITPLIMERAGISLPAARELAGKVITGDWMLSAAVTGPLSLARQKTKHVKRALAPFGRVYVQDFQRPKWKSRIIDWLLRPDQRLVLRASEQLRDFHLGKPSDAGVRFLMENSASSIDENPEGFLLCTPLAPLSGENARMFAQVVHDQGSKHRVRLAMTQNILTSRVLEAVISVHFLRRSSEERARAHSCLNEMTEIFSAQGFYPYRINIDQHRTFANISPAHASVIASIKSVLDPNGIIAPGRYGPHSNQ